MAAEDYCNIHWWSDYGEFVPSPVPLECRTYVSYLIEICSAVHVSLRRTLKLASYGFTSVAFVCGACSAQSDLGHWTHISMGPSAKLAIS